MQNWNLEEIYKSNEAFLEDLNGIKESIKGYLDFKGKLNNSKSVNEYFKFDEEISKRLQKLYSYASMKYDLNTCSLESQANISSIENFFVTYMQTVSFVKDELLSNKLEDYKEWAKESEYIKNNLYYLDQLFHSKEHVLKPELENLLSLYSPISSSFSSTYGLLESSDIKPITVTLSDGTTHTFTKANYTSLLMEYSNSQTDRKTIFEAMYKHYDDLKNTYAQLYKGVVDTDIARMRSHGYDNILDTFLDNNKIDKSVYLNLLEAVHENTKPLHRYIEFRRKHFGLKEYHNYDRFLSLAKSDVKYPYEYARTEVLEALKPMGEDFVNHAKVAMADGHVDVCPDTNKRSGAYSTEVEGFGPYILLNHTDDLDSAFTLAHECGHSIHTLYSTENQPFATKDYVIFVAEIASTFNEQLFLDHLLSKSSDKATKIQAIEKLAQNIVSTFYRQALFAEFELKAHNKALEGRGLTYDDLNNIMAELYEEYYGYSLDSEELKKYVWAYIPHIFNSPFYVYQYATCFSASFKIYNDVKNKVPHAYEKYIDMLKAGGSDYPVEIVKKGGCDLTTKDAFVDVCKKLDELTSELEKLID